MKAASLREELAAPNQPCTALQQAGVHKRAFEGGFCHRRFLSRLFNPLSFSAAASLSLFVPRVFVSLQVSPQTSPPDPRTAP